MPASNWSSPRAQLRQSRNGDLCSQKLKMPTEFVAQSGATLTQNTHIEVEGCEFMVKVKSGGCSRGEPRRTGMEEVRL